MGASFPQQKKIKITSQCSSNLKEKSVSMRGLMQVPCPLSTTITALLVASIQYLAIQRQQITELVNTQNSDSTFLILLTEEVRKEL